MILPHFLVKFNLLELVNFNLGVGISQILNEELDFGSSLRRNRSRALDYIVGVHGGDNIHDIHDNQEIIEVCPLLKPVLSGLYYLDNKRSSFTLF